MYIADYYACISLHRELINVQVSQYSFRNSKLYFKKVSINKCIRDKVSLKHKLLYITYINNKHNIPIGSTNPYEFFLLDIYMQLLKIELIMN